MAMRPLLLGCFCSAFFCLVLAGCGSDNRGAVSGKVTLDGQPLKKASIAFIPMEGTQSPSSGGTIENGTYAIERAKGPMAGSYRVEIRAPTATGKKILAGSPAPPGTMVDEVKEAVPCTWRA